MIASSRSFGIVMIVSTQSRSASSPRSACSCRLRPSNLNGLVTTATVSAPSSVARLAITGAAPVPVPPPRPVVTKIMSAPSSAWMILSVSSSAAERPTFGSAPAPSPLVSLLPICSLIGAKLLCSACRSVLATMNSTPSRPARAMRLTALPPPPPTPITLIRAPLDASSSSRSRRRRASSRSSRSGMCSNSAIPSLPSEKLSKQAPEPSGHTDERAGAGQDDPGVEALFVSGAADLVPDQVEDLLGARLQDLGEDSPRHHPRLAAADAGHLHRLVLVDHRRQRAAALALDLFRVGHR